MVDIFDEGRQRAADQDALRAATQDIFDLACKRTRTLNRQIPELWNELSRAAIPSDLSVVTAQLANNTVKKSFFRRNVIQETKCAKTGEGWEIAPHYSYVRRVPPTSAHDTYKQEEDFAGLVLLSDGAVYEYRDNGVRYSMMQPREVILTSEYNIEGDFPPRYVHPEERVANQSDGTGADDWLARMKSEGVDLQPLLVQADMEYFFQYPPDLQHMLRVYWWTLGFQDHLIKLAQRTV